MIGVRIRGERETAYRRTTVAAPQARAASVAIGAHESAIVFGVTTVVAIATALWYAFIVRDAVGDALSRTYAALVAVHAADPHLAAIGFIWPPLPTLLQIPLLIAPRLAFYGASGNLVTALFAGLTAVVVNLILVRGGLPRAFRMIALILFFLNPLIAFYAVNGMSEMPFVYFLAQATYCYLRWADTRHWPWIVYAALSSAAMALVRYDTLFFAAAFVGAIFLTIGPTLRQPARSQLEAVCLTYLAPVVYVFALWIFFNWQIKGDPLYFWNSEYSNAFLVRGQSLNTEVQRIHASIPAFAAYILRLFLLLSPLLVGTLIPLAIVAIRRWNRTIIALLGLLLVVPLFQAYSYRAGQTFGFLRFYISLIPAGVIAACELIRLVPAGRWRQLAPAVLCIGLLVGNLTAAYAMERSDQQTGLCDPNASAEQIFLNAWTHPTQHQDTCRDARAMAEYIGAHITTRSIITDVSGNPVVVFSGHPASFVLLSDRDYEDQARTLPATLEYVLIDRTNTSEFHALTAYFPTLDTPTTAGLTLVDMEGDYRLYRIQR